MSQSNPVERLREAIAYIQRRKAQVRQGHDLAIVLLVITEETRDLERAKRAIRIDASPKDIDEARYRAAWIGGLSQGAANLLFRFSGSSPIETTECALFVLRRLQIVLQEDDKGQGIDRGDINDTFAALRRDQERRKLKRRAY